MECLLDDWTMTSMERITHMKPLFPCWQQFSPMTLAHFWAPKVQMSTVSSYESFLMLLTCTGSDYLVFLEVTNNSQDSPLPAYSPPPCTGASAPRSAHFDSRFLIFARHLLFALAVTFVVVVGLFRLQFGLLQWTSNSPSSTSRILLHQNNRKVSPFPRQSNCSNW